MNELVDRQNVYELFLHVIKNIYLNKLHHLLHQCFVNLCRSTLHSLLRNGEIGLLTGADSIFGRIQKICLEGAQPMASAWSASL